MAIKKWILTGDTFWPSVINHFYYFFNNSERRVCYGKNDRYDWADFWKINCY